MNLFKGIIIISLLFIPTMMRSQIYTSLPDISSCNGNVTIPVLVSNFNNVGAITLTLEFDSTLIKYTGFQQRHPSVQSMLINKLNNTLYLTWASVSSVNIGNDTLIKLNFNFLSDSAKLKWDTLNAGNCEYSNSLGNTIISYFKGNSIISTFTSPGLISPANNNTEVNNIVNFNWSSPNCASSYKFQLSNDSSFNSLIIDSNISGTNIGVKNLTNLNTYYWRVGAINIINTIKWSVKRNFYYANTTSISEINHLKQNNDQLLFYPNPCNQKYFSILNNEINCNDRVVMIYNSAGILISTKVLSSKDNELINTDDLTKGLYFIIYRFRSNSDIFYKYGKLIIEK